MQQAVAERTYTIEEFCAEFAYCEGKAELVDGKVVWIFGPYGEGAGPDVVEERFNHASAKLNLAIALREAIAAAGAPLVVVGDGMSLLTGIASVRGPDAGVLRLDELALSERRMTRPVILCEVLSPTTRRTDLGPKVAEYFALPSVTHYVIVDPAGLAATVYTRTPDGPAATTFADGDVVVDGVPPTGARIAFPLASLWVV